MNTSTEPNLYRPALHSKKDGLLLVTCTGQGRFLTWFESIQVWLGLTNAEKLERKICHRSTVAGLEAEVARLHGELDAFEPSSADVASFRNLGVERAARNSDGRQAYLRMSAETSRSRLVTELTEALLKIDAFHPLDNDEDPYQQIAVFCRITAREALRKFDL